MYVSSLLYFIMMIFFVLILNIDIKANESSNQSSYQQSVLTSLLERSVPELFTPSFIVDIGCGKGDFLPLLADRFPKAEIWGLDRQDLDQVQRKKLHSNSRIHFSKHDIEQIPPSVLKNKFDFALSVSLLHLCSSPEKSLKNIKALLKKDAILLIQIPLELPAHFAKDTKTIMQSAQWKEHFKSYSTSWRLQSIDQYKFLAKQEGLNLSKLLLFEDKQEFAKEKNFADFLREWYEPYLHLPLHLREEYLKQFIEVYLKKIDKTKPIIWTVDRAEFQFKI